MQLTTAEARSVASTQLFICRFPECRFCRLSSFVLRSVIELPEEHCGQISIVCTSDPDVSALRCGELIGLSPGVDQLGDATRVGSVGVARELASALLRCAELAEGGPQ